MSLHFDVLTIRNFWVNTKDLQVLTLVEPTRENLIFGILDVLSLNNRAYIYNTSTQQQKELLNFWKM